MATGLNYQKKNQWAPSKEEIDIQPDGSASATQGQHQAYFPADIYEGVVRLVTPEGKSLISRPVGLSYDDGSNTVLIAELTNSVGYVVNSNQIVYPNAFGALGDLRFTYRQSGFEQDVILREQPPTPEALGLDPDRTRIQVLTEFFNPPQPTITSTTQATRAGNLIDNELSFGTMRMTHGKAFMLGNNTQSLRVDKRWMQLNGRQLLVEEVPVPAMADQLQQLPPPVVKKGSSATGRVMAKHLVLPPRHLAKVAPASRPIRMAQAMPPSRKGYVLDYTTVNSTLTGYTFRADMTYYVSGWVYLYGTTTFEPDTVLKYASGAAIDAAGNQGQINWQGNSYRPVTFTAVDDNSVGQTISGSTGNPSGYYALYALDLYEITAPISYFRIAYAQEGILAAYSSGNSFYNGQLVNCQKGLECDSDSVKIRNVLFENVNTVLNQIYSTPIDMQNCTFNYCNALAPNVFGSALSFENCIFASVGSLTGIFTSSTVAGNNNGFYSSPTFGNPNSIFTDTTYPFQSGGAGNCYLYDNTFRGQGTANIDPLLLVQLAKKTTYPPNLSYIKANITAPTTLSATVPRDTNPSPDLGYHYDPLDYVFGGVTLSANLTLNNGVAVGMFETTGSSYLSGQPYTLALNDGANLNISGSATSPVWLAVYNTVQEGWNASWAQMGWLANIALNGSGTGVNPIINGNFARFSTLAGMDGNFQDNWAFGTTTFNNSEFYSGDIASYRPSIFCTNCLFFRVYTALWDQRNAASFTSINCTYYNGCLALCRSAGQSASFWNLQNNAFDGTTFVTSDNLAGASGSTFMGYNAYNTANLSWQTFVSGYSQTGTLEKSGAGVNDQLVNGFTWQASYLGGFYQPNIQLVDKGSGSAANLGLYHFTTQANQAIEGNTTVDIGYHYVATDGSGNSLDTLWIGTPDYLADPNGKLFAWEMNYFGFTGLDPNASYDGQGNTLLQDYQNYLANNVIDPNVMQFTSINVASDYVKINSVPATLTFSGAPYYVAVSVDDPNYCSDATWTRYSSAQVTLNLGSTEGWHDVWIGLRGYVDSISSAVWQHERIKVDITPPKIAITSPTVSTVSQPIIQLQGTSDESLSSISYDILIKPQDGIQMDSRKKAQGAQK